MLTALAIGFVLLLLSACDWPRRLTLADPVELTWRARTLVLAWDPPLSDVPHSRSRITSYEIYYRQERSGYWQFLEEVPASEYPEYTVCHEAIGSGKWVFAVRAVSRDGSASYLHSSLDSSADPTIGWYVNWIY